MFKNPMENIRNKSFKNCWIIIVCFLALLGDVNGPRFALPICEMADHEIREPTIAQLLQEKALFSFSEWPKVLSCWQGFRGVFKSLKCSYIKFKALKSLKLYKKVLIMISRGLKFGDGKTRIAIWLNVTIKLQKAMKHECCTFKAQSWADLCTALTRETVNFTKRATCWQRMNVQFQ